MSRTTAWCCALLAGRALACEGLAIDGAWIREAPPVAHALAAYGELRNDGARALEITAISSDAFGHVMIHETTMKDGAARMAMREAFTLAPGQRQAFAPGGLHFMLMHPREPLQAGAEIVLEFACGDARSALSFPVRPASAP